MLELVYTAYELRPFAEDMGYHGEPFRWDALLGRRAQIRSELDAYYARLYGLTRDELRYILDPKEVHDEDFPERHSAWQKKRSGIRWRAGIAVPDEKTGITHGNPVFILSSSRHWDQSIPTLRDR